MLIGVPAEVKNNEFRVALTPSGVHDLVSHGHEVTVQAGAGIGDLAALRGRSRIREAEALCAADGLGGFTVMHWVR